MPSILVRVSFLFLLCVCSVGASADDEHHHALSLIRTPKYAADFTHFDYVNPNAPKGGIVKIAAATNYDNLNGAIFSGILAPGLGFLSSSLIEDQLMASSLEEPDTAYCLVCVWVNYPSDYSSATFKLRKDAHWHDGKPLTADDVVFSMNTLKATDPKTGAPYSPQQAVYYKNVVGVEKIADDEVKFSFDTKGNRELPLIVGQLTILPKHYWTGQNADGKPRDITRATLEPPLGSGPYRIKSVHPGDTIIYERVKDYWAINHPTRVGSENFEEIQFQYYGDPNVSFEAFKSGQYDFKIEASAKTWATGYDFPALKDGRVVKRDDIVLNTPHPMQSFAFNMRRAKFQDIRVRRALNLVYDFDWANQNLFFGQYRRTSSYFEGQELASKGLPTAEELKILEPLKNKIPAEVFTQEYRNPENKTPNDYRNHLRDATRLLAEAGWQIVNGQLKNAAGDAFTIEFLISNDAFVRVILPYIENLRRIGINATVRQVDSTEEKRREDNFDFDILVSSFAQSESPGNEQRDFWGSPAADQVGSRNVVGIKNQAIDTLIDKIIFASNRDDLVTATHALDRVLLWNQYVIPQWYAANTRIAYWNKFAAPNPLPSRSIGFPTVWWYDAERAKATGQK